MKVLHSICQQVWKTQQWPQDWKRSVFIPITKKGNPEERSNYYTISLILNKSKGSKFSKWGFNSTWIENFQMFVHAGFRKGRGTRDQIANIHWIIKKAREFQKKTSISASVNMPKLFVDHNKLWKILKEMGTPDYLICLLRYLYACQQATVRTGHRTTEWFQIRKGVCQGCILSPCLFKLYAEYIMWNARLDES